MRILPNFGFSTAPRLGQILDPVDNSLNFIRLVLASLVLISHSFLYLTGTSEAEPLTLLTGRSLGEYAVQAFFILSGVMVAQSFERSRSVIDFAAARALRIFPALIICVLLTALALGPLVTSLALGDYLTDARLPLYIIKTLSLSTGMAPLPGVFESNPLAGGVNTSLWTLKYEVICYIGLAAAALAGLFNRRWRAVIAIGLATYIVVTFFAPPVDPATYAFQDTVRYFSVFFGAGVLAYLVRDRLVLSARFILPAFAIFALTRFTAISEAGSAIFLAYISLWAATFSFGPMRTFSNRFDLSYGVYIYAGPIQQSLIHLLPGIGPLALTLGAFAMAAPAALLSWTVVERPALRLRLSIAAVVVRIAPQLKPYGR